jgi:hypothetical protein
MMRHVTTFRLYMLGLAVLFGVYVLVESHRPKPLDWTPTYFNTDKIPYGTYALFDQLPHLLGTDSVEVVRLPAYNQLTGIAIDDTPQPSRQASETDTTDEEATAPLPLRDVTANYLFVNNAFDNVRLDVRALLAFVRRGNNVFITAEDLNGAFLDSLGVQIERLDWSTRLKPGAMFASDSVELRFTNPALAAGHCWLPSNMATQRFILGPGRVGHTLATDAKGRAVYIEMPHGRGHFYLCAVAAPFSNLYFLRPRTRPFAVAALRYLPARRTFWDEYQKQGPAGEQSLLRVLVAHEALRLAYFVTLAGALLFAIMGARRRQRIIPTIKALPNTTLLFTRTVAGLYRQGSSHALIAEKKVSLFMDYLRTRFQENSPDFGDDEFRERLSQKSGLTRTRVDELLRLVNFARTAPQVTDQQLLQLSKALSDFRHEAGR